MARNKPLAAAVQKQAAKAPRTNNKLHKSKPNWNLEALRKAHEANKNSNPYTRFVRRRREIRALQRAANPPLKLGPFTAFAKARLRRSPMGHDVKRITANSIQTMRCALDDLVVQRLIEGRKHIEDGDEDCITTLTERAAKLIFPPSTPMPMAPM
jgi:hypothetical protein